MNEWVKECIKKDKNEKKIWEKGRNDNNKEEAD